MSAGAQPAKWPMQGKQSIPEGGNMFSKMSLTQLAVAEKAIAEAKSAIKADFSKVGQKADRYRLALEAGVRDDSYETQRDGRIPSFSGRAIVALGERSYIAIGHGPEGDAYYVDRNGFIEFIPQ